MKLPVFFNQRSLVAIFALSFLLVLLGLALVYVKFSDSSRPLIVHFDSFRGIDFFGTRSDVFNIIFIALAVLFVNLFLASALFERERLLSYLLAFFSFIFSFLILIALAVIISVN